jgi:alkanesulfonate monooxygenase SsuD/methylene tetrahydromethanopterin reductase-like flavin-dependent oxidoreductase (luciferase family)
LRRLARLGDGWFPLVGPDERCRGMIETICSYAKEAGRDPSAIGIEGRIGYGQGSAQAWLKELEAWKKLGATHVSLNTMKAGLGTPAAHIDAIRRFQVATTAAW